MKTTVSITPIAVTSDSRTYKIAASFTRFGYDSIVVEGLKSDVPYKEFPFVLRDVEGGVVFSKADGAAGAAPGRDRSVKEQIRYLVLRLFKPFLNQLRTFLSLPRASLYYLHSFYQFPAVFLKSRLLGVGYIYDAHDFYLAESPGRLNRWMESLCVKYAAAVVTVAEGIADLLQDEYGRRPVVIRNSHDIRLEEMPGRSLRETLALSASDFLVVVVGQAKDGMAITEAMQAMMDIPSNLHLAFVGKNSQDYSTHVEQAGVAEQVHLVPPVTPNQVVPFVRSADAALILYYPRTENYRNCLPNGFFQSLSAGLPILYPDLSEIRRLADEYGLGISVDTQSPQDIRRGILQLVESGGRQYKPNLERARRELSWEHEEQLLHNVVETLLHGQGRSVV